MTISHCLGRPGVPCERGDQAGESEEQGGRGRGRHRGGHEGRARRSGQEDHHLTGTCNVDLCAQIHSISYLRWR